jgi:hypothetical protein
VARLVTSLRRDQEDPTLGAKGLLVNFLDLSTGKRLAPLAADVEKRAILEAFGPERGEAIWKAMREAGWIVPRVDDTQADIRRGGTYGFDHFDGALAPHKDDATRRKLMEILDRRVVMVIFGDNANLSASVAKTIGALLAPEAAGLPRSPRSGPARGVPGRPEGGVRPALRRQGRALLLRLGRDQGPPLRLARPAGELDDGPHGLPRQRVPRPGDLRLRTLRAPRRRDPQPGLQGQALPDAVGGDALRTRALGRLGLPGDGPGIMLPELHEPAWRELLTNVVDIEVDFATRKGLPGFLSESYTGDGVEYTGSIGIPEITVNPRPRITDVGSLYTLGVAYTIAPAKVERFLAANWPAISGLLTDHGPWEGFNATRGEVIRFQTTAHTLSLILGILATGTENMMRYAEHAGIAGRLDAFFPSGERADLLADGVQAYAWSDQEGGVRSSREDGALRIRGESLARLGIAFVPTRKEGVSPSGGT